MERLQLVRYLDSGLSLDAIAELAGKHPSTISYWLKSYGLEANGAVKHSPKGGIRREELTPLVARGLTTRVIAERLGRSQTTVRYWIRKFGLREPIEVRNRPKLEAQAAGLRTFVRNCRTHGETVHLIENSGRARCRRCRQEAVSRRRRKIKRLLVEEAGGRCALCGYNGYVGALQFHHRDPSEKEFNLAAQGVTRSMDSARAEAAKCTLLCANCHAEVEAGLKRLP